MKISAVLFLVILFTGMTILPVYGQSPGEEYIDDAELADLGTPDGLIAAMTRRYMADYGSLDRFHTAPYSPYRTERFRRLFTGWLGELERVSFDSLSLEEKVDYLLFGNHLRHQLQLLRTDERRYAEMESLIPFAPALIALEDNRRKLIPVDPQETAGMLDGIVLRIAENRKRLDSLAAQSRGRDRNSGGTGMAGVKQTVANRAFRAVNEIRSTLSTWFRYSSGYDPVFTWWVTAPFQELDSVLEQYGNFLRDRIVGVRPDDDSTIIGDPIGREALLEELRYEMIPYTPEELLGIARKEMEWCRAEMLKASEELGYGDDWRGALEHVKTLYVEPGEQPALIRDLAVEAIRFLEERNLITIPTLAKETWRMEMMSPERQKIAPFFLGGEVIQVSYPTSTMSHEEKMMSMRGNNRYFARATVHHELIPGHHLQGFMNSRFRTYRRLFGTPFWMEGWALYWELALWDLKFPTSPEEKIGMLFWRTHRCARIIFSLGFHLGTMSPGECVDYLVEQVGHERENALAEVRRSFAGDYGPLYQAAYLLGGLQFRSLHRDLVGPGKMTDKEFHDAILRNGPMPVEMVRALITGEEPRRDYTTGWRFYGEGGE